MMLCNISSPNVRSRIAPNAILNQPLQRDDGRAAVQQASIEQFDGFGDRMADHRDFFVLMRVAGPIRRLAGVDVRQEQDHELVGEGGSRSKAEQSGQLQRMRSDFLMAFAARCILGAFAWIYAAGGNLDHVAAVECEMATKPELPGQHDLLALEVNRQHADHEPGPQYFTFEGGALPITIESRYDEAVIAPKSIAEPFGLG